MPKRICTFAERLRQGMDFSDLKASDLARLSGIGKSSLSHYINGHYEGKQDAVYLLAKALNVSEAWLMGYNVPMERVDTTPPTDTATSSPEIDRLLTAARQLSPEKLHTLVQVAESML